MLLFDRAESDRMCAFGLRGQRVGSLNRPLRITPRCGTRSGPTNFGGAPFPVSEREVGNIQLNTDNLAHCTRIDSNPASFLSSRPYIRVA